MACWTLGRLRKGVPCAIWPAGTSCTKSWMLLRSGLALSSGAFFWFFLCFSAQTSGPRLDPPWNPLDPSQTPLDTTRIPAPPLILAFSSIPINWTLHGPVPGTRPEQPCPLKSWICTLALKFGLRFMRQQGQRLRAFMLRRSFPVDSPAPTLPPLLNSFC